MRLADIAAEGQCAVNCMHASSRLDWPWTGLELGAAETDNGPPGRRVFFTWAAVRILQP